MLADAVHKTLCSASRLSDHNDHEQMATFELQTTGSCRSIQCQGLSSVAKPRMLLLLTSCMASFAQWPLSHSKTFKAYRTLHLGILKRLTGTGFLC